MSGEVKCNDFNFQDHGWKFFQKLIIGLFGTLEYISAKCSVTFLTLLIVKT